MYRTCSILLALPLLVLASMARAQPEPAPNESKESAGLTLAGFAHGGKTVLFRRTADNSQDSLIWLTRDGRAGDLPEDQSRLVKSHRHGTAFKGDERRLTLRGRSLQLTSAGKVMVGVGKARAPVRLKLAEGCKVEALEGGLLSRRRYAMAAVLRLTCEEAPATRRAPLAISLRGVMNQQFRRYDALAARGKLDPAASCLDMVRAISPGATRLYYRRAHLAALRGKTAEAVRWLRKLRNKGTAAARKMVVKARWDAGFRLVKDSAAFKEVTTL